MQNKEIIIQSEPQPSNQSYIKPGSERRPYIKPYVMDLVITRTENGAGCAADCISPS